MKAITASVVFGLLLRSAAESPPPADDAREALRLCGAVGETPAGERAAVAARGLALAERAIAADPAAAPAHLAAFCNLGKQMKLSRNPFGNLWRLRRLRHEVDTTLALDPDCADALVGKGLLLVHLPRLLGGDPVAAEALLRRGLARDPDQLEGRLALAELLRPRDLEAARIEARRALATAEREGEPGDVDDARALLRSLGEDGVIARGPVPGGQSATEPSK